AVGIDVADLLPRLRIVAQRQNAEERVRERRQRAGQHDVVELDRLAAALDRDRDLVALVLAAQHVHELRLEFDLLAVDLDDGIAWLEAGLLGGRLRGDGGNGGRRLLAPLHGDAQQAAAQVLALAQPRQRGVDVLERNGEADARIVPLDAGRLPLLARRR